METAVNCVMNDIVGAIMLLDTSAAFDAMDHCSMFRGRQESVREASSQSSPVFRQYAAPGEWPPYHVPRLSLHHKLIVSLKSTHGVQSSASKSSQERLK